MRNEILDEIVRAERIAGTLLNNAREDKKNNLAQTKKQNQKKLKQNEIDCKNKYKILCEEIDKQAYENYQISLAQTKLECEKIKKEAQKNMDEVIELLTKEVMK